MSATETDLETQIEDYLKNFPLGKSQDEIEAEFSGRESETIEDALQQLKNDDTVLEAGGNYRWTG